MPITYRLLLLGAFALLQATNAQPQKALLVTIAQGAKGARTSPRIHLTRGPEALNVIVIDTSSATPRELEESVEMVRRLRAEYGDTLQGTFRVSNRNEKAAKDGGPRARSADMHTRRLQWYAERLRELRVAELRDVPSAGQARAIDVVVPGPSKTPGGK